MHRIRPLKTDDLETILEWRNAKNVRKNMYSQNIITIEEHRLWWARTKNREDARYFVYQLNEVSFGVISFTAIDKYQGHASWAFYAAPDAPKGTGSWMEVLALDYALIELGLNKLTCEVLSYNVRVIDKHKNFGFKVEGVFVEQFRNEFGYSDIIRLALFANDWRSQRSQIVEKLKSYSG